MSISGERKELKENIIKVLDQYYKVPTDPGTVADAILYYVKKPERTVMHIKETAHFRVRYYVCGKCSGICQEPPMRFCPECGRRVIAIEDDTICMK